MPRESQKQKADRQRAEKLADVARQVVKGELVILPRSASNGGSNGSSVVADGFDLLRETLLARMALDVTADHVTSELYDELRALHGDRGVAQGKVVELAVRQARIAEMLLEDYEQREIADLVGVSLRTVESDVALLRLVLRPRLEALGLAA